MYFSIGLSNLKLYVFNNMNVKMFFGFFFFSEVLSEFILFFLIL